MNIFLYCDNNITNEQFNDKYVADIKSFIEEYPDDGHKFYVDSSNTVAQEYLKSMEYDMVEYKNAKDAIWLCQVMMIFLNNTVESLSNEGLYLFVCKSIGLDEGNKFREHVNSKEWTCVAECLDEAILPPRIKDNIEDILVL